MYKLYSQRLKESNNEIPDVYEYDNFPETFRVQIVYLFSEIKNDTFFRYLLNDAYWNSLIKLYKTEKGFPYLNKNIKMAVHNSEADDLDTFIMHSCVIDFIDFIDLFFNSMYNLCQQYPLENGFLNLISESVSELNTRFKQHNLGYEFSKNQIIRIDNKFIHKETIKPALMLLNLEKFSGAEEEFRKAFEFRRSGDNKSAILEAAKAFESTMKIICKNRKYPFNPQKDTANKLISILSEKNFFPSYMNHHLESVTKTLSSGLPTARNKLSGHGQGSEIINVSDSFAEYALSLAATNIVLLVNLYKEKYI